MSSIHAKPRTAVALMLIAAATAHAADVTVQPAAGSGFVVAGAGGQTRLRVNENGEIVIPVLVGGVQKNMPICVDGDGAIGPCTPDAGGGAAPTYAAGAGLALDGTTFSVVPSYQLPQSCAINQIAQWSGTAWACGSANGGGTSFALPYTGLIDSTDTAFGIGNDGNGIAVYGRSGPASGRFAVAGVWGDATDQLGVWGSSISRPGVWGESTSETGVVGKSASGSGVSGSSDSGAGVYGESQQFDGVHGRAHGAGKAAVAGFADGDSGFGVLGGSGNGPGVQGVSTSGVGVVGASNTGYAMFADGPVKQRLHQPGWLKAMFYVARDNADLQGSRKITQCFNSQLPASSATVPPCDFDLDTPSTGLTIVELGYPLNGLTPLVTIDGAANLSCGQPVVWIADRVVKIETYELGGDWADLMNCPFWVLLF